MSGHNKWSKIKRAKGAADAKRSKQWSNILKQVTIAVREGGPDPDSNPRLTPCSVPSTKPTTRTLPRCRNSPSSAT